MGILKFGFPERLFYDNKEDSIAFLDGLDIDLTIEPLYNYPTLGQVKIAIRETTFQADVGQIVTEPNKTKWVCGLYKGGELKTPIYIEDVQEDIDKVKSIYFQRGDDEAIFEFLRCLSKFCGSIVFYHDSGNIVVVRESKTIEQLKQELGYYIKD